MIIIDEKKFCFIHIPKCGGTSMRTYLEKQAQQVADFPFGVNTHSVLGELDYNHIPLKALHDYFPLEFSKAKDYHTVAIIRDPFERFKSSLSQRITRYTGVYLSDCTEDQITNEVAKCIDYLIKHRHADLLPHDYIHFQKQSSYVYYEDQKIVDSLFLLSDFKGLMAHLNAYMGSNNDELLDDSEVHANKALVYRNQQLQALFKNILPFSYKLLKPVLPSQLVRYAKKALYVPRDERKIAALETAEIDSFIRDYYAEDLKLFEQLSNTSALNMKE